MKRKLFLIPAALLAMGMALTGCETEDRGQPDYGENLISEAAILAATGAGGTSVEKEGNKYKVSGTIVSEDSSNWITLTIRADPNDLNKYFAGVNRYTITCEFPDSSVKPYESYGAGLDLYFENIKTTANTPQYVGGNWQSVPQEEYNAIRGVGTMVVDRNLTEYFNADTHKDNVGDYHHLVIRVKFPATAIGREYSFHISNVGVYGEKIDNTYPGGGLAETPVIHANSMLNDATYSVDATAQALRVVPEYTLNREDYTYQWYSNNENSTTGATLIPAEQIGTNADYPGGWQSGTKFIPPTDTAGTVYYYVVISYPQEGTSTTSRIVKIEITE